MTTSVERRATWPGLDEVCPSWCPGGHNPEDYPEDRRHWSATAEVGVTCYRPWQGDNNELVLACLFLGLRQAVGARYPKVELIDENLRGGCYQLQLTLDEAAAVARTLLELVEQATG